MSGNSVNSRCQMPHTVDGHLLSNLLKYALEFKDLSFQVKRQSLKDTTSPSIPSGKEASVAYKCDLDLIKTINEGYIAVFSNSHKSHFPRDPSSSLENVMISPSHRGGSATPFRRTLLNIISTEDQSPGSNRTKHVSSSTRSL